jgi:hypothetical protein
LATQAQEPAATEQQTPTPAIVAAQPGDTVITLGQPGIELSNFDRYKGRKNVTDRLAFISKTLRRGFTYYINKKRILLPKDPKLAKLLRDAHGEPKQEFAIIVFHYSTDEDGNLISEEKLGGKVKLWRWSEAKYTEYSELGKKWPIMDAGFDKAQHDLSIKCTEEQYQRMNSNILPGNAHWKKNERWYEALIAKRAKAEDKLMSVLGFEPTEAEVLELLGASQVNPTGSEDSAGAVDLSDVID